MKNLHVVGVAIFVSVVFGYWRARSICTKVLLWQDDNTEHEHDIFSQPQQPQHRVSRVVNDDGGGALELSRRRSNNQVTTTTKKKRKRKRTYDPSIFDIDVSNYTGPARAFFVDWTHSSWSSLPSSSWSSFPCFPIPRQLMLTEPSKRGLLFQRPHKTGSTTMAAITMRMAHRHAQRMMPQPQQIQQPLQLLLPQQPYHYHQTQDFNNHNNTTTNTNTKSNDTIIYACDHRANHGSAVQYQYAHRDKSNSFLFTILRNPTRRAVSHFFHFGVVAYRKDPRDVSFQRHVLNALTPSRLLQYVSVELVPGSLNPNCHRTEQQSVKTHNISKKKNNNNNNNNCRRHARQLPSDTNYTRLVQNVLEEYDFIALLERFDESLVLMKMMLHLDFEDILYTQERSEGTFSNGEAPRPCVYILPSFITPGMKEFFTSNLWKDKIQGDILLYQAVHKSLDWTIDRLGREEFQRQLTYFQRLNQQAQDACQGRAVGMCSEGGDPIPKENRTCYIWSEGCSHSCLDEFSLAQNSKRV